jgi:flagellar motor switch protein FliN
MADDAQTNPGGKTPKEESADAMLAAARAAISQLGDMNAEVEDAVGGSEEAPAVAPMPAGAKPLDLQSFSGMLSATQVHALELLSDVHLNVKIELGRTRMLVEDVLRLSEGSVVELDKLAGDPVDVYVNDRHVAKGEVLVLNDSFCVRINEVLAPAVEGEDKGAA